MTTASLFKEFIKNIHIQNADAISENYNKVTKALNEYYYESNSDSTHCRQIGSYGRKTGINGISDLDMAFELPKETYDKFHAYATGGQSALLQDVKKAIQQAYDNDQVKADGQIVGIDLDGFRIEVLPTFYLDKDENGTLDYDVYTFPDTNDGGRWRKTKPKLEIEATRTLNNNYGHDTYRHLCRMVRAWKNHVGAKCSGLWIDTLVFNFLRQSETYKNISYKNYGELVKDFFKYLFDQYELSPDQKIWKAPGSNQNVHGSWQNHRKIKKAYQLCLEALDDDSIANEKWSKVFGVNFPEEESERLYESFLVRKKAPNEQFIEFAYNGKIDIRNTLRIDYNISGESKTWRELLATKLGFKTPVNRKLEFFIASTDLEPPYQVKWKVKNVGINATNRERGQLLDSTSGKHMTSIRVENSNFDGEHWVECYLIKNGICVARDRVKVPI
ncbi:SMODS domain-containing nucleotidyltransferase [Acinetobacter tandoii]|jgi:hypothetical protein